MAKKAAGFMDDVWSLADCRREMTKAFIGALERKRRPASQILLGAPGIGKTHIVYQVGQDVTSYLNSQHKELGKKPSAVPGKIVHCSVKCLLAGSMEPVDLQGVPFPDKVTGQYSVHLPLKWAWDASKEGAEVTGDDSPMLLFFDDFPVAHPQTQAAFYKFIHEGMIGDLHLRDNVMIVAAGNRVEDNSQAHDMPSAMGNRFRIFNTVLDPKEWFAWAQGADMHWLVLAFFNGGQNSNCLHDFEPNANQKIFASPRSWENFSEALYEAEILGMNFRPKTEDEKREMNSYIRRIGAAIVGLGPMAAFMAFVKNAASSVSPEEIVKDPAKARLPAKTDLDVLYATVCSLENYIYKKWEDWEPALVYMMRKGMPEELLVNYSVRMCKALQEKGDAEVKAAVYANPTFQGFVDRYGDLIPTGNE
jgi:hypothetical protein